MAIADGQRIVIRFTQPLVDNVRGNESKFTVSFDEYNYVPEGTLFRAAREVDKSEPYTTVDVTLDLLSGSYNGIAYYSGALMLAKDKGVE